MTDVGDEVVYTVRLHDEGSDGVWAEVVELPGCFASADNLDELKETLAEAIGVYLSTPTNYVRIVIKDFKPCDDDQEIHVLVSA